MILIDPEMNKIPHTICDSMKAKIANERTQIKPTISWRKDFGSTIEVRPYINPFKKLLM